MATEPLPELSAVADGVELTVKVVPGASRTRVSGVWNTALKVAVAAPPEGGKANRAVCELLAEALGVKRAAVEIRGGHSQPVKRVWIGGVTVAEVAARLRDLGQLQ